MNQDEMKFKMDAYAAADEWTKASEPDEQSLHAAFAAGAKWQQTRDAELKEFVEEVSQQTPEKPDYWSSCGQCQRNSDKAEDILDQMRET